MFVKPTFGTLLAYLASLVIIFFITKSLIIS